LYWIETSPPGSTVTSGRLPENVAAIGGGARLASGIVGPDAPCYAVEISGGASQLLVADR
jgi:hypothetical protein